jgi:hypothetical protein
MEKYPKYYELGKIIILLDKLYTKNVLSVKVKQKNTLNNIIGLNNILVSDDFVNIIINIYKDNKKPTRADLNRLNELEKDLLDIIFYKAGLHKVFSKSENIIELGKKLENKYDLTLAEIEAGNDNNQLLKRLKKILDDMQNIGKINSNQLKIHYNEIKNKYYSK